MTTLTDNLDLTNPEIVASVALVVPVAPTSVTVTEVVTIADLDKRIRGTMGTCGQLVAERDRATAELRRQAKDILHPALIDMRERYSNPGARTDLLPGITTFSRYLESIGFCESLLRVWDHRAKKNLESLLPNDGQKRIGSGSPSSGSSSPVVVNPDNAVTGDATSALVNLGYRRSDAKQAIEQALTADTTLANDLDGLIRQANGGLSKVAPVKSDPVEPTNAGTTDVDIEDVRPAPPVTNADGVFVPCDVYNRLVKNAGLGYQLAELILRSSCFDDNFQEIWQGIVFLACDIRGVPRPVPPPDKLPKPLRKPKEPKTPKVKPLVHQQHDSFRTLCGAPLFTDDMNTRVSKTTLDPAKITCEACKEALNIKSLYAALQVAEGQKEKRTRQYEEAIAKNAGPATAETGTPIKKPEKLTATATNLIHKLDNHQL